MKVAVYTLRTTAVITAGKVDTVDIKSRSKVYRPPGMKLVFRAGETVDVSVVCSVSCDADETGTCETVHAALPRWSLHRHVHIQSSFYQSTFITVNQAFIQSNGLLQFGIRWRFIFLYFVP